MTVPMIGHFGSDLVLSTKWTIKYSTCTIIMVCFSVISTVVPYSAVKKPKFRNLQVYREYIFEDELYDTQKTCVLEFDFAGGC